MPGKLVDMMLSGNIGVRAMNGDNGGVPADGADPDREDAAALASAIADATGTLVSRRQPAGTQPCLLVSVSRTPEPVGSRWTTHHPRARERITNVSPLFDTH